MNYSPQDIKQGVSLKKQAEETPSNFGILDGATEVPYAADNGNRMAGQKGSRIAELMNNPVEEQRTKNWMNMFGMTNEGMQFNQARMMMANPQPQQPQEGQK